MDNKLNNIKNEAAKLALTPQEKIAMKARIFEAPAPAMLAPKQSPYFIFTYQFMQARVLAPLAVLLVVFAGAGTAAAAQGSLPGDILYPVKLSVNEAVQVAFATTPVARAEVSAQLAVRRVEEAEVLASRGELTPASGEALAANFEAHAKSANEFTDEVEAKDPAAAESLRANLGSSLEAHGAILATLTVGGASANQEGAGAVAAKVLARSDSAPVAMMAMRTAKAKMAVPATMQNQVMTMSTAVDIASDTATTTEDADTEIEDEATEDTSDSEDEQQEAAQLRVRALAQISEAREEFDDSKASLAGGSVTQVSGEFAAIEGLMQQGSSTQATADYGIAASKYTQALKRATKIDVLLRAQANFKQNIISPILEKSLDESSYEVNVFPEHI